MGSKNNYGLAKAEQWLANSKKALENSSHLDEIILLSLHEELKKRQQIVDNFQQGLIKPITFNELAGTYAIIGFNQNAIQSNYHGYLHLTKTGARSLTAEWVIAGEQTQKGTGFFNDDILVINFSYRGSTDNNRKIYKGVVVYTVIQNSILHGFWSEKHGDNSYIGLEEGRKLEAKELISFKAKWN